MKSYRLHSELKLECFHTCFHFKNRWCVPNPFACFPLGFSLHHWEAGQSAHTLTGLSLPPWRHCLKRSMLCIVGRRHDNHHQYTKQRRRCESGAGPARDDWPLRHLSGWTRHPDVGYRELRSHALTWIEDRRERSHGAAACSDSTHIPYRTPDPAVAGQKKWRLFAVCSRNRVGCVLTANKLLHGSNGKGPRTPPPGGRSWLVCFVPHHWCAWCV